MKTPAHMKLEAHAQRAIDDLDSILASLLEAAKGPMTSRGLSDNIEEYAKTAARRQHMRRLLRAVRSGLPINQIAGPLWDDLEDICMCSSGADRYVATYIGQSLIETVRLIKSHQDTTEPSP